MPHAFDFFWSEQRVDSFTKKLPQLISVLGIKPHDLPNLLARWVAVDQQSKLIATEPTYRRAVNGKRITKRFLSGLLIGIVLALRERSVSDENDNESVLMAFQLYEDFENECYSRPEVVKTKSEPPKDKFENTSGKMREVLNIFANFLELDFDRFRAVEDLIFKENDGNSIYFDTYRFSSNVSHVKKSFTVFHRATDTFPLVRFANFVEHKGRTREGRGLVVPFRNQLALLGQADRGKGIKMIVLPDIEGPQTEYQGMMMTTEPEGNAVSARTLLVRSEFKNHLDAKAEEYHIDDLPVEIMPMVDRIRNRVHFKLEEKLSDGHGNPLQQKDVVSLIDRYIRQNEKPKIVDSNGHAFNPASDEHYTFNSALKISD